MAKIDFPSPAAQDDTYTQDGKSWVFNGEAWETTGASTSGADDTAYGISWDGDTTTAPSKNAVYDKIETLGSGVGGGGGGGLTWGFGTSTSSGAAQGEFRYDAAFDPTGVSNLYLSKSCTESGFYNAGGFINKIKSGDVMHVVGSSSGYHSSWNVTGTPTDNGSYLTVPVSSSSTDYGFASDGEQCSLIYSSTGASATEGTSVLSTGETGGTKFLREDGDGTCSWQTVGGGGGTQQGTGSTYYNIIPASEPFRIRDQAGEYSVDLQMQGNGDDVAAGQFSVLIGGRYNSASGTYSTVIAGNSNTISNQGSNSTIISSSSCSVTYSNSAVIAHSGNLNNTTLATYNSAVLGGSQHTLDGFMGGGYAAIIGGVSNSGYYMEKSVILGGNDNSSTNVSASIILGGNNNDIEYSRGSIIGGTRVKAVGAPLGRLDGVFAYADDNAVDYIITQENTANFRVANGMHISSSLFLSHRTSALPDISTEGQLWVRNANNKDLMYTDASGSDMTLSSPVVTFANLPNSPLVGARAFVTDSNNALSNHHGQIVASGGANFVPVFYNGSNWIVG
jgi:hypothetical protein